jgi:hypothetical protein
LRSRAPRVVRCEEYSSSRGATTPRRRPASCGCSAVTRRRWNYRTLLPGRFPNTDKTVRHRGIRPFHALPLLAGHRVSRFRVPRARACARERMLAAGGYHCGPRERLSAAHRVTKSECGSSTARLPRCGEVGQRLPRRSLRQGHWLTTAWLGSSVRPARRVSYPPPFAFGSRARQLQLTTL